MKLFVLNCTVHSGEYDYDSRGLMYAPNKKTAREISQHVANDALFHDNPDCEQEIVDVDSVDPISDEIALPAEAAGLIHFWNSPKDLRPNDATWKNEEE